MALSTKSKFYYGLKIDTANNIMNFDEGGPELSASLSPGIYGHSEIATVIKTAFDAVGALVYTVSVDRDTRQITISTTATISLLSNSGTQVNTSPWQLFGFDTATDKTGASSYEGENASGSQYKPQFWLQDYLDPNNNKEKVDESVNEAADGSIEVISFGDRRFAEMSIRFITDLPQDGKVIEGDPNGVSNANAFFDFAIDKGNFEFMPDKGDPDTFFLVVLESLEGNQRGTGYRLKELVGRNLPGYFEVNNIKLRVVE